MPDVQVWSYPLAPSRNSAQTIQATHRKFLKAVEALQTLPLWRTRRTMFVLLGCMFTGSTEVAKLHKQSQRMHLFLKARAAFGNWA